MKKYISFFMMMVLIFTISLASTGCRPEDVPPAPDEDPAPDEGLAERRDIEVPLGDVPAIEDMIVDSAAWQEEYPLIYESFMLTSRMGDNTVEDSTLGGLHPIDYLEKYPNIRILYDGFGFAKEYFAARGHYYAMEDVINIARPKPGANCLACKTGEYEGLYVEHGEDLFLMDFYKTAQEVEHAISCYSCHRNDPEEGVQITSPHFAVALQTHLDEEPPAGTQACAQCHVEYYFDTDTGEVVLPWANGLGVDDIEAYFDERDFADWIHPRTGTPLIKVQHPEFEMYTGSVHDGFGLSCADCHMPTMTEDGEEYVSHWAKSPLKTVEESCGQCHNADTIIEETEELQREIDEMQVEVSDLIVQLIEEFADALERRVIDDEEVIDQLRSLHRASQYRWDFVMVENSTGFHNVAKAKETLERAKEQAQEALDILAEYQ